MWLDRLRAMKEESGLTTREIAAQSGIPEPTLEKLFAGATKDPKLTTMQQLVHFFGCMLDDLDDGPRTGKRASTALSEEARQVARDYDGLDRHGRNMTRVVIAEEQKRMTEEQRHREPETGDARPTRILPLYYTPAAAGMTSPAAGEDFDYIEVDSSDVPWNADFAVKIDGDSMEPYIRDGSTVFVNREPLENGDVGIFCIDGDMICKQYYKDAHGNVRLLSLNRERRDADRFISHRDSDTVLTYYGRVILPRRPLINMA